MSHELEEMRSQINILKEKLGKQAIVNEEHIRRSMKSNMSDMNRTVRATIATGVFAVVFCPIYFHLVGCSLTFILATGLMLAVCLVLTILQKINLGSLDMSKENLVAAAQKLSKVRTHYKDWYKIAIPMILIWLIWMLYEMIGILGLDTPSAIGFYVGVIVGCIIGGIIGGRINRKIVRQANEVLAQIEELQKDN